MFGKCGNVKFIDFGFAVNQTQYDGPLDKVGTPHYVAPEVFTGIYDH